MTTEEKRRDKLPHEALAAPVQDWLHVLASKWALEVRACESSEDARWMLFQNLAKMLQVMGEGIYNAQQEKLSELSREIAYDRDELLRMVRARLGRAEAALSMEQVLTLAFVLEVPIRAGSAGEVDAAAPAVRPVKQGSLDAVKLANGRRKTMNLSNGGHRGYKMRKITAIEVQGEQVMIRLECGHERRIFPYLGRTAEQYATELQQGITPFVIGKTRLRCGERHS